MSKKSSIGHFARIPLHVAHADVSETAKGLWRELAFFSSPESSVVWVRQSFYAEKLNRSVKTVQRALKELMEAKLISFVGWLHGRYKRYKLAWKNFLAKEGQNCPATQDTPVSAPETSTSEDLGHFRTNIIREEQSTAKQNIPSLAGPDEIAGQIQRWQERFACLDGKNGRPALKEVIEHAFNHKSRHKYDSPVVFLEMWLRNAAARWMVQYQSEKAHAPSTAESIMEWQRRRAEDDAREMERIKELERTSSPFF